MVITSHLCKETLTETQGQSGYQRSESKLCFLMMTKTHNDWHINHYNKDFFITIFQKMENFEEKKDGYFDVMPYAMKVYMHF